MVDVGDLLIAGSIAGATVGAAFFLTQQDGAGGGGGGGTGGGGGDGGGGTGPSVGANVGSVNIS
ncbi:MAG: hypothetical protein ABEJ66_01115 [Candidatus Nanohaloarchaea archaeon]